MSTQFKRVAFHTMGCKLNFSETSTISKDFVNRGFKKVDYRDFNNCIAAMAIMAYVIADMEKKLPR